MKEVVRCRAMEAKFHKLAASDPANRVKWLAEAQGWNHLAEAEVSSHFAECNTGRSVGASHQKLRKRQPTT